MYFFLLFVFLCQRGDFDLSKNSHSSLHFFVTIEKLYLMRYEAQNSSSPTSNFHIDDNCKTLANIMAANNVYSTPIQPKYILRNPLEVGVNTKSIQLLRIKDNESFLGFPIPDDKVSSPKNPEWRTSLASAILPTAGVPISRILNHPNIVSLIDIIHTDSLAGSTKDSGITANIAIYEDMDQGSLDLILPNPDNYPKFPDLAAWRALATPNPNRFSLPESLCWHVLGNINKALLWLHSGVKQTDSKDDWQKHDDDWQSILIRDVSPKQIWFKRVAGGATYGECKLGGFGHATVTGFPGANVAKSEKKEGLGWWFQPPVCFFVVFAIWISGNDLR